MYQPVVNQCRVQFAHPRNSSGNLPINQSRFMHKFMRVCYKKASKVKQYQQSNTQHIISAQKYFENAIKGQQQNDSNEVIKNKLMRYARTVSVTIAGVCVWNLLWGMIATNSAFAAVAVVSGASSGAYAVTRSAGSGLIAGILHTLCGPDHLAALTPLTMGRGKFVAALLGALWGFGHGTGQLCLGIAFTVLKEKYKQFGPFLTKWSGVVVALTLVAIGTIGLIEILQSEEEEIGVETQATAQLAYAGEGGNSYQVEGGLAGGRAWTTYATGVVYGLQPDALYVVVPALALSIKLATAYCFMFVIGTVASMVGFSVLVGSASEQLKQRHPHILRNFSIGACIVAICLGLTLLFFGDGFTIGTLISSLIGG
eukprot:TRINITY_DN41336_c0_g1_i1.p1 TRINITY_DN41336_c0_g1~~TRINITY_DN41336_c0_g1_i1.p1  ORF type:complete len:370 (-),score=29.68 TRINITY_DN41336_c0_g1_i1:299-1408(-)